MQPAGRSKVQVASVSWERLFGKPDHKLHIYKRVLANVHESPRHMIPIPAALVCPKTCDTVAEDACNIASHLSIDRTHDKWGILRQSWSSHVREPPNFFKCEVRRAPFLVFNPVLDAICRAQQREGCKCLWERLVWNRITAQPQAGRAEDPTLRKARVVFCWLEKRASVLMPSWPMHTFLWHRVAKSTIYKVLYDHRSPVVQTLSLSLTMKNVWEVARSTRTHVRKAVRRAAIIVLHDKRNCAACKTKCSLGYCGQTMAGQTCRWLSLLLVVVGRWYQVFDSFACIPSDTWTRRWCIFQPHKIDQMLPFSFSASAQTFVVIFNTWPHRRCKIHWPQIPHILTKEPPF